MDIDLRTFNIDELQLKVTKTLVSNFTAQIVFNSGCKNASAVGYVHTDSGIIQMQWDYNGKALTPEPSTMFDLDLSELATKCIDYAGLPKDTLCLINSPKDTGMGVLRYSDGEGRFYGNGKDSFTAPNSVGDFAANSYSLIQVVESPPAIWYGRCVCPVPDGVLYLIGLRNGKTVNSIDVEKTDVTPVWQYNDKNSILDNDVVYYQILGEEL